MISIPHKCDGCFWRTDWKDESGPYPICEKLWWESFERTKEECAKPGPCKQYLSEQEGETIVNKLNTIAN